MTALHRFIAVPLIALSTALFASEADPVDPGRTCPKCPAILKDIRLNLSARCDQVPSLAALRKEPIYVFLSIYEQVSEGVDKEKRDQVYQAALEGMRCDNLGAGIEAANQVGKQLFRNSM